MAHSSDSVSRHTGSSAQSIEEGAGLNKVEQAGQEANNFLAGMYAITEKLDEQRAAMEAAHKQVTEAYQAAGQA